MPKSSDSVAEYLATQRPAMLAFALKLTRDQSAAEDLVQATAERALRRAGLTTNLAGWMNRIMYRLFVDQYRWSRRRCRRPPAVPLDEIAAPAPDDEDGDRPWAWLTLADVRRAVARLPPAQRAAFELYALEGLSYDETATRLGIPARTVGTRLLRARLGLRALLEAAAVTPLRPMTAPDTMETLGRAAA